MCIYADNLLIFYICWEKNFLLEELIQLMRCLQESFKITIRAIMSASILNVVITCNVIYMHQI